MSGCTEWLYFEDPYWTPQTLFYDFDCPMQHNDCLFVFSYWLNVSAMVTGRKTLGCTTPNRSTNNVCPELLSLPGLISLHPGYCWLKFLIDNIIYLQILHDKLLYHRYQTCFNHRISDQGIWRVNFFCSITFQNSKIF